MWGHRGGGGRRHRVGFGSHGGGVAGRNGGEGWGPEPGVGEGSGRRRAAQPPG